MPWVAAAAIGGSLLSGMMGANAQKDAAETSADAQIQSGRESIDFQRESRDMANARLDPFVSWGQGAMPLYTGLLNPQNQANYLMNNPIFQAAMQRNETGMKNRYGPMGLRGDMQNAITQNYMASGDNYITSAMNRLLTPIQMAQNSAAGGASNIMNAGANIGNTMEGIGNANAAGIMGAGNAMGNFYNNIPNNLLQGYAAYRGLTGAAS